MSTAFEPAAAGHHRETCLALPGALNPPGLPYLHIAGGPDTAPAPKAYGGPSRGLHRLPNPATATLRRQS
jgi:hypothetical protein